MRKSFLLAAAALVAAVACNKEEAAKMPQPEMGVKSDLTVSIANASATKATGVVYADDEAKVNTLEIFVFNGDALDAYKKGTAVTELTLSCTAGPRSVYAIVNAEEDYSGITSKAALLAKGSQLQNNDLGNMVMVGSTEVTLPQTSKVNIDVNRIASRVVIKKITSALEGASAELDFTVDAIYLLNAAGEQSALFEANATLDDDAIWYNKIKQTTNAGVDGLIYDAVTGVNLKNASSSAVEHDFYCYPNPTVDDENEGSWSARHTRLVIKTTIGGTVYYYPLTMPVMESNHSYEINEVIIKHLGNIDLPGDDTDGLQDTPVKASDVTFQITVKDWIPVILSGEDDEEGIWTI